MDTHGGLLYSYITTWLLSYMGRVKKKSEKGYSKDQYIALKLLKGTKQG